jgi:hypothetical protein
MGLRPRRVGLGAGMARRRRRRVRRRRIMLAGGMVAFGARKMSQHHAKQIEEHTGVPPSEPYRGVSRPASRVSCWVLDLLYVTWRSATPWRDTRHSACGPGWRSNSRQRYAGVVASQPEATPAHDPVEALHDLADPATEDTVGTGARSVAPRADFLGARRGMRARASPV